MCTMVTREDFWEIKALFSKILEKCDEVQVKFRASLDYLESSVEETGFEDPEINNENQKYDLQLGSEEATNAEPDDSAQNRECSERLVLTKPSASKIIDCEDADVKNGVANEKLQMESSYWVNSKDCSDKIVDKVTLPSPEATVIVLPVANSRNNQSQTRFANMDFTKFIESNVVDQLAHLKQQGTVKEYEREFKKLADKIDGFPENKLIGCFIMGLKDEITVGVQPFWPNTLDQAIGLAKLKEMSLEVVARISKNSEETVGTPTVRLVACKGVPPVRVTKQEGDEGLKSKCDSNVYVDSKHSSEDVIDNFEIEANEKQNFGTKNDDTRFVFDLRGKHWDGSYSICNKSNLKLGENFSLEGRTKNSNFSLGTQCLLDGKRCLDNVLISKIQHSPEIIEWKTNLEDFLSSVKVRKQSCDFGPHYFLPQAFKTTLPVTGRVGLMAAMKTQTIQTKEMVQQLFKRQSQDMTMGVYLYKTWDPGGIDSKYSIGFMPLDGYCQPVGNEKSTKTMKTMLKVYRPYQVLQGIGKVAYKLALPSSSKISPVFHVSLLKQKFGHQVVPQSLPPAVTKAGTLEPVPLAILDRRLVKFKGKPATQLLIPTWEFYHSYKAKFPLYTHKKGLLFPNASRFPRVVDGAYLYAYTIFNELTTHFVFMEMMLVYHLVVAGVARSRASLPFGITGSHLICAALYCGVCLVLTVIISIGAAAELTTTILFPVSFSTLRTRLFEGGWNETTQLYSSWPRHQADNVFVQMLCSIQYQIIKYNADDAFYELQNPKEQIQASVFDVVRAHVPKMTLDELFEQKGDVAQAVLVELEKMMGAYGYKIEHILMVDIIPDASVCKAMNEINAAQRFQLANIYQCEAEKILHVKKKKKAEANAEAKYLGGVGVARQRQAITDGLRENILNFSDKVAYKLALPASTKIHPVFHVSLLKRKLGQQVVPPSLLPDVTEAGTLAPVPTAILDHRLVKLKGGPATPVLVQWSNSFPEDATWEFYTDLKAKFPTFEPCGQGLSQGGGNDTLSTLDTAGSSSLALVVGGTSTNEQEVVTK